MAFQPRYIYSTNLRGFMLVWHIELYSEVPDIIAYLNDLRVDHFAKAIGRYRLSMRLSSLG